jgi:hypothetical protein
MSGMAIADVNPSLKQKISISYIRISVSLPSKPEWAYVGDGTLDLNAQDKAERDAWNALSGNAVKLKIGDLEEPLNYSIKNVLGGYSFDLTTRCSKGSIMLNQSETLQLKLLTALGSGDSVAFQCYGTAFIDDENYR